MNRKFVSEGVVALYRKCWILIVETTFEVIDLCPPQTAPDVTRVSPFADQAGRFDVDKNILWHKTPENIEASAMP